MTKTGLMALILVMYVLTVPAFVSPIKADEPSPSFKAFNEAVDMAFGPARISAGYLRTGNFMPATLELDTAVENWDSGVMPFASNPPPLFAGDAAFASDIKAMSQLLHSALSAAESGDAAAAAEPVAKFRQALSALRRRNGIEVFADCLLDLTTAMDAVWQYRSSPPDFDNRAAMVDLSMKVGVLKETTLRCDRLASDEDRARDSYPRLIGGMIDSMTPLSESVRDADQVRFINVLREQRSLERLIAMEFG